MVSEAKYAKDVIWALHSVGWEGLSTFEVQIEYIKSKMILALHEGRLDYLLDAWEEEVSLIAPDESTISVHQTDSSVETEGDDGDVGGVGDGDVDEESEIGFNWWSFFARH